MSTTERTHVMGNYIPTVLGPKVTVLTHAGHAYIGWLVGNTADGGVEIEHGKNGLRWAIAKSRIKAVRYWT